MGLGLAAGCRQLNASHCGNQAGDATCMERNAAAPYCNRCEPTNDGCVADPVSEPGCGQAEVSSGLEATASATAATDAAATDATATDAASTAADASSTTEPDLCGNGVIDGDEACDGEVPPGLDCATEGFGEGTPVCLDDCTLDYTECSQYMLCGNGEVGFGEDCDGTNLGGRDCASFTNLANGTLACTAECTFDTSGCLPCAENGEMCVSGQTVCCDAEDMCGGLPTQCCNGLGCVG